MIIQIYGLTDPKDAADVAALGAHRVGVVVCDDPAQTPDGNSVEDAEQIMAALPEHVTACVLTFSTDVEEISDMVRRLHPPVVHLSKSLDLFPLSQARDLKRRFPELRLMPAIPVTGPSDVAVAREWAELAEVLLLDTPNPEGLGGIGATGRAHDWSISREIVAQVDCPVILAGGLSADNVAEAIRAVRPWGVDSFTLTSRSDNLRRKDPAKVAAFIKAATEAGRADGPSIG